MEFAGYNALSGLVASRIYYPKYRQVAQSRIHRTLCHLVTTIGSSLGLEMVASPDKPSAVLKAVEPELSGIRKV